MKLCAEARCADPAVYRGRCRGHSRQREAETHTNRSFYGSKRWRMLRRAVLHDQPLCACGEIATDVDHIVPIEDGGGKWDRSNLRGMCLACHARKTNREVRER